MISYPPSFPGPVRGVVFDLDGTLVDSYEAIARSVNHARSAFALFPLEADEVRRRVGRGLESLMADLVGPDRVEEAVRLFREEYARVFERSTHALPGALVTLRELRRRGYRLAVASNKPARFGEPILDRLGMRGYLDAVAGPDTVGAAKPDPRMIEWCLREIRTAAQDAVYVGDMVLDAETGNRVGVRVVLVAGGSSTADELRATGWPVLDRLEALVDLLEASPTLGPARSEGAAGRP